MKHGQRCRVLPGAVLCSEVRMYIVRGSDYLPRYPPRYPGRYELPVSNMQPASRGTAPGPGRCSGPHGPISLVLSTHVLEPFVHPGPSTLELPALRSGDWRGTFGQP